MGGGKYYDAIDRIGAMTHIRVHSARGEVLTAYDAAFNTLCEKELCPEAGMLEKIDTALP